MSKKATGTGKLSGYIIVINDHVYPTIYNAVKREDYLAFMNGKKKAFCKSENIGYILEYLNKL